MFDQSFVDSINNLAIELAGNIPSWKPYYWESLDSGLKIKGCATTFYKRGPQKGNIKYLINQESKTVFLSESDLKKLRNKQD